MTFLPLRALALRLVLYGFCYTQNGNRNHDHHSAPQPVEPTDAECYAAMVVAFGSCQGVKNRVLGDGSLSLCDGDLCLEIAPDGSMSAMDTEGEYSSPKSFAAVALVRYLDEMGIAWEENK